MTFPTVVVNSSKHDINFQNELLKPNESKVFNFSKPVEHIFMNTKKGSTQRPIPTGSTIELNETFIKVGDAKIECFTMQVNIWLYVLIVLIVLLILVIYWKLS